MKPKERMRVKETTLSVDRLREVLDYCICTGEFRWRKRISIRIVVGRIAGVVGRDKHRYIRIDGVRFQAHRLAWFYVFGCWPTDQLDHRDLEPDNNRLRNLRQSTQSQNSCNTRARSHSRSGLKGAIWNGQSGKWRGVIVFHRKVKYLGSFETPEEAHAAYANASIAVHGEFGRVN